MSTEAGGELHHLASTDGVLACGLRLVDGRFLCLSTCPDLEKRAMEGLWREMAETAKAFALRRLPVTQLCWKFRQGHLCWLVRRDGMALGLVLEPAMTSNLPSFAAWFARWSGPGAGD